MPKLLKNHRTSVEVPMESEEEVWIYMKEFWIGQADYFNVKKLKNWLDKAQIESSRGRKLYESGC